MQTNSNYTNLVTRQTQLLQEFAGLSSALSGVVAMLWLPGLRQRFNGPRAVRGTRPLCVALEVKENDGLILSGAISRPKNGKLLFDVIFKYDFCQPMCDVPAGNALSVKNEVVAGRGLNLLQSLVQFGQKKVRGSRADVESPRWPNYLVPFNHGEETYDNEKLGKLADSMDTAFQPLYKERLKQEMTDKKTVPGSVLVNAAIVPDELISRALASELGYEDYQPVLGVSHWNPVRALREQCNPAAAVLAKHNVSDLDKMTWETTAAISADFRAAVELGECLVDEDIYDALCNPDAPVVFSQGVGAAEPKRLVAAMRRVAGNSRAAREASDADLLAAATAAGRMTISALSATQICAVDVVQELPAPYAGGVLPSQDWEPVWRRTAAVHV